MQLFLNTNYLNVKNKLVKHRLLFNYVFQLQVATQRFPSFLLYDDTEKNKEMCFGK